MYGTYMENTYYQRSLNLKPCVRFDQLIVLTNACNGNWCLSFIVSVEFSRRCLIILCIN